jgi:hypothetical protein
LSTWSSTTGPFGHILGATIFPTASYQRPTSVWYCTLAYEGTGNIRGGNPSTTGLWRGERAWIDLS